MLLTKKCIKPRVPSDAVEIISSIFLSRDGWVLVIQYLSKINGYVAPGLCSSICLPFCKTWIIPGFCWDRDAQFLETMYVWFQLGQNVNMYHYQPNKTLRNFHKYHVIINNYFFCLYHNEIICFYKMLFWTKVKPFSSKPIVCVIHNTHVYLIMWMPLTGQYLLCCYSCYHPTLLQIVEIE